jgi:hypothetical protein
MVVTGDLKQSDRTKGDNGLRDLMYKLRQPDNQLLDEIKMVEMQYEDVERSQIVKTMLQLYSKDESKDAKPKPKPKQQQEHQCCSKKTEPDNDAALIPKKQLPTSDFLSN